MGGVETIDFAVKTFVDWSKCLRKRSPSFKCLSSAFCFLYKRRINRSNAIKCNLSEGTSGKMLSLRKEADRNWVSSLSDNFSYVSHDNRKQKDMKKPRAYLK